jgi:hypothetical protein
MPETAYVQQAILVKKQAQQASSQNKTTIAINFAIQMQNIMHARQLEMMRGSLGV